MSGNAQNMPQSAKQPASVYFIDREMQHHHQAFSDAKIHYDPTLARYEPNIPISPPYSGCASTLPEDFSPTEKLKSRHQAMTARPEWTEISAMERWNELFLEAMTAFKHAFPQPRRRPDVYSIRTEPDWEAIYAKLEKAQVKYQSDGGRVGWFRKKRRSAADNASVVSEVVGSISAIVPDTVFSTPIFGVVQLLLDAANKGADVRAQASEGLDGLIPIFSDVELLLAVYPGDRNIQKASLSLAISTLEAIERLIGFFLSKSIVRFGKTLGQGSYYGSDLVQSLQTINQKAEKVVAEATKSYQFETRLYSQETMRLVQKVHCDIQKTNFEVQTKMASMYTNVMVLLDGHTQKRDRELEEERERGRRLAVEVASLRVENTFLRSASPGLQHSWGPYTPPRPQNQPALEWVVTKEVLLETLQGHNADIDESFALSKESDFPSRERTHAQQIVGNRLFQDWIASPRSSKLLVHWDGRLPRTIADLSPLSLFCASMSQMLRGHPRFIPLIWLCGLHLDPDESSVGGNSMLCSFIDQLLRRHEFDLSSITTAGAVDLNLLQSGDDKELLRLLYFLVLQIPDTITLVFLIDNVGLYEREEMHAFDALFGLLGLANEKLPAAVKLLFTSTPGTTEVRGAFEDEGLILNVDTLPSLVWAPSDERVARELEDIVQE